MSDDDMDFKQSHVCLMVTWISDDVVGIEWSRGIVVTDMMIMTRAHRLATITLRKRSSNSSMSYPKLFREASMLLSISNRNRSPSLNLHIHRQRYTQPVRPNPSAATS